MAKWTPRGVRHTLGRGVGAGSNLAWRSKRLVTQQNMAQVTGRPVQDPYVRRLAFSSWVNYGRYAADFISFEHIDGATIERNADDLSGDGITWQERLREALRPGRGAIITSGHFGNWDYAGAILTRHTALSAVAETFSDERLNELIQQQRQAKDIGIIPMEGSARRILRVLQQNQLVAIVTDRPVTADQGTAVTFFGRTTYVPAGPAALALKTGASIIPGFVWYGRHGRYCMHAFPPIFPQAQNERTAEITRLTQYTYDALEVMVRDYPTQWYMFRPFWPSQAQVNRSFTAV